MCLCVCFKICLIKDDIADGHEKKKFLKLCNQKHAKTKIHFFFKRRVLEN